MCKKTYIFACDSTCGRKMYKPPRNILERNGQNPVLVRSLYSSTIFTHERLNFRMQKGFAFILSKQITYLWIVVAASKNKKKTFSFFQNFKFANIVNSFSFHKETELISLRKNKEVFFSFVFKSTEMGHMRDWDSRSLRQHIY